MALVNTMPESVPFQPGRLMQSGMVLPPEKKNCISRLSDQRIPHLVRRLERFLHVMSERQQELQISLSGVHESVSNLSSIINVPEDSETVDDDGQFLFPGSLVGEGAPSCGASSVGEEDFHVTQNAVGSFVRLSKNDRFEPLHPATITLQAEPNAPSSAVDQIQLRTIVSETMEAALSPLMLNLERRILIGMAQQMEDGLDKLVSHRLVPRVGAVTKCVDDQLKPLLAGQVHAEADGVYTNRVDANSLQTESVGGTVLETESLVATLRSNIAQQNQSSAPSVDSGIRSVHCQTTSYEKQSSASSSLQKSSSLMPKSIADITINPVSESLAMRRINHKKRHHYGMFFGKTHEYLQKAVSLFLRGEPRRTGALAEILTSKRFESAISSVIMLNVWFIGYSAEYAVQNLHDQTNTFIQILEVTFQVFYIVELALKIWVHREFFFIDQDEWKWNVLDFLLVVLSVYDLSMTYVSQTDETNVVSGSGSGFNVTFLRMLRLLRVAKIFRAFRVMRFFRQLRVMLSCIVSSLGTLFWCSVMLGIFYYIFAIIFMHAVTGYLTGDHDEHIKDRLLLQWGGVLRSMLSLFEASTGGKDWAEVGEDLEYVGMTYFLIFIFYIAFILIAVLNILTGIFVDNAIRVSDKDASGVLETMEKRQRMMDEIEKLFYIIRDGLDGHLDHAEIDDLDVDYEDFVTKETYESAILLSTVRARFEMLNIDTREPQLLFFFLSNASNVMTLKDFANGCLGFRGHAENLSIQSMRMAMGRLAEDVRAIVDVVVSSNALSTAVSDADMDGDHPFPRIPKPSIVTAAIPT